MKTYQIIKATINGQSLEKEFNNKLDATNYFFNELYMKNISNINDHELSENVFYFETSDASYELVF